MQGCRCTLMLVLCCPATVIAAADRTTTYHYTAEGRIQSIDGPRRDVADVTQFGYDASGNRATQRNALGHVTRYTAYDAAGRLLRMIDPNGLVTSYRYHPRGWLLSRTVGEGAGAATTALAYDPAGNLTRMTWPAGDWLAFGYDTAGRLSEIVDAEGNRLSFVLDAMGNRVVEQIEDGQGSSTHVVRRFYDDRGRLLEQAGAAPGRVLHFAYDANGNLTGTTDALGRARRSTYDALDRPVAETGPSGDHTAFGYDARDNLVAITDPRGNTTGYAYNAFDETVGLTSPETGHSTFDYDEAGNLVSRTDARGIAVAYEYDALNRLTGVRYPDSTLDVTLVYDQGLYGVGRLTRMHDATGLTDYAYDQRGNLIREARVQSGLTLVTAYAYDDADRLIRLTYPSGQRVHYSYGAQGRAASATLERPDGSRQLLADGKAYLPFGPLMTMSYGNGLQLQRTFDQDYRLVRQHIPDILDSRYAFGVVDNITVWGDGLDPSRSQGFGYDLDDRLRNADGPYGTLAYTHDPVGNRLGRDDGMVAERYLYDSGSNRLIEIQGGLDDLLTYDAAGNTLASASGGFSYDDTNRLTGYTAPGVVARYAYNGRGERVRKTVNGEVMHFRYAHGQLIGEYDATGRPLREYAYLHGRPIALMTGALPGRTGTLLQKGVADHDWVTVDLGEFADVPVVIAGPPSYNGGQAAVVALRNLTRGSVEVAIREWLYLNVTHITEDFPLLAMPPGRHDQGDGSIWEFGRVSVGGTKRWRKVAFTSAFAGVPKVFVTVQTSNDPATVIARVRNVGAESFEVALFEEEALQDGHAPEQVGYLAVYSPLATPVGTVDFGGGPLAYQLGAGSLDERWGTYAGVELSLQEEQSKDSETNHLLEHIHTLDLGGHVFAQDVTSLGGDTAAIRRRGTLPSLVYQAGTTGGQGKIYYAHTDHLGAVIKLTNQSGQLAWDADRLPFGEVLLRVADVEMPLRLPGQYHDEESGLHYNYFRDYDPRTGRYIQSDPIGLGGGLNTYAYVGGNPLRWSDPYGLFQWHGNWCGSNWTGGHRHPYVDAGGEYYAQPISWLDNQCRIHDICYAACREDFRCNKSGRAQCMTRCDRELASASPLGSNSGSSYARSWLLYSWMKVNNLPDPEEDPPQCGCSQ